MSAFIRELWQFLKVKKKRWIAPVLGLMLLIAALLIAAQGSVVAPFIYALF